jgi:hypothetical protein
MPRPPTQPMRRDFTDPADIAAWDASVRRRTGDPVPDEFDLGPMFGPMAASPLACALANAFGVFVRDAGERENTYSHAQRELVDQVLAHDFKMNNVLPLHIPDALATGVRMDAIKALRYEQEHLLNDEETLLVSYIRQVVERRVKDATWEQVEELMGTRGVVEYTVFILWLQWLHGWISAIGMKPATDEQVDKLIADLETGAAPIPDFYDRIPSYGRGG